MADESYPLVSIFVVVKNARGTIRRCIESLITDSYPNKEIIVQDGASDDGTSEIVAAFSELVRHYVEKDSGISEGFYRAIRRCSGEYLICILADEELIPGVLENRVAYLEEGSDVVYGDRYTTTYSGEIKRLQKSRDWDYKLCLESRFVPFFCTALFRRQCLLDTAILNVDEENYEGYADWCIWWLIGSKYKVRYVPGAVAKFAIYDGQLGRQHGRHLQHTQARYRVIMDLTKDDSIFSNPSSVRSKAIFGIYLHNAHGFLEHDDYEAAKQQCLLAQKYYVDVERVLALVSCVRDDDINLRSFFSYKLRIILFFKFHRFFVKIKKARNIVIMGAWEMGLVVLALCRLRRVNVLYFIDNDPQKSGHEYYGIKVFSLNDSIQFAKDADSIVITSERACKSVCEGLRTGGYEGDFVSFY
jgi:glycosyltransferase involved in cell wall biosynthesis